MSRVRRQAWWAPVAAFLVVCSLLAMIWIWTLVVPFLAIIVLVGLAVTEVRPKRLAGWVARSE